MLKRDKFFTSRGIVSWWLKLLDRLKTLVPVTIQGRTSVLPFLESCFCLVQDIHTQINSICFTYVIVNCDEDISNALTEVPGYMVTEWSSKQAACTKEKSTTHIFKQQYWLAHWMKRQILGGWLSYKGIRFLKMLYSLWHTELWLHILEGGSIHKVF